MYTRAEYLKDSRNPSAFSRYYGEIIAEAGGPQAFASRLPCSINRIRRAIAEGDAHLNTIPLPSWGQLAIPVPAKAAAALRARGDYPTLANAVCVLKEAARLLAAEKE